MFKSTIKTNGDFREYMGMLRDTEEQVSDTETYDLEIGKVVLYLDPNLSEEIYVAGHADIRCADYYGPQIPEVILQSDDRFEELSGILKELGCDIISSLAGKHLYVHYSLPTEQIELMLPFFEVTCDSEGLIGEKINQPCTD